MWTCPTCEREFQKNNQAHSCVKVSLESHFKNKEIARGLFDILIKRIEENIGKCKIVSLPCCVHLYGNFDFLAVLPKKDRVEIRFALNRKLNTPKLKVSVPMSSKVTKYCFDIYTEKELDDEFMGWLKEAYTGKE